MMNTKMGPVGSSRDDGHQDGLGRTRRTWVPRWVGQDQEGMMGTKMGPENQEEMMGAKMGPAGPSRDDGHQDRSSRSRRR